MHTFYILHFTTRVFILHLFILQRESNLPNMQMQMHYAKYSDNACITLVISYPYITKSFVSNCHGGFPTPFFVSRVVDWILTHRYIHSVISLFYVGHATGEFALFCRGLSNQFKLLGESWYCPINLVRGSVLNVLQPTLFSKYKIWKV